MTISLQQQIIDDIRSVAEALATSPFELTLNRYLQQGGIFAESQIMKEGGWKRLRSLAAGVERAAPDEAKRAREEQHKELFSRLTAERVARRQAAIRQMKEDCAQRKEARAARALALQRAKKAREERCRADKVEAFLRRLPDSGRELIADIQLVSDSSGVPLEKLTREIYLAQGRFSQSQLTSLGRWTQLRGVAKRLQQRAGAAIQSNIEVKAAA